MDRPTVYIETSVVSYLAARPSRHPETARKQATTREWWARRSGFRLFASEYVHREAVRGNPEMVRRRLGYLSTIEVIEGGPEATLLAAALMRDVPLPTRAGTDALHIALAAVTGVAYLLTWNCRHIANPALAPRLRRACRARGYELPVLCTPGDLPGGWM